MPLRILIALLALAFAAGCLLTTDFNPEGKPCGNGEACLDGYVCATDGDAQVCVRPDAGN